MYWVHSEIWFMYFRCSQKIDMEVMCERTKQTKYIALEKEQISLLRDFCCHGQVPKYIKLNDNMEKTANHSKSGTDQKQKQTYVKLKLGLLAFNGGPARLKSGVTTIKIFHMNVRGLSNLDVTCFLSWIALSRNRNQKWSWNSNPDTVVQVVGNP